jgi:peptidoglycan/xylan/chitin deacetylase (PgdA/CDA1 family)
VLLTFDDGPGAQTADVLDVLREHGLRATFFLVGGQVAAAAGLVARIVAEGHTVGNHSWDHPHLTELDEAAIEMQLWSTSEAIEAAAGLRPAVFRPPYGDRDERVDRVAAGLGMRTLLWDVDPADWSQPGAAAIAAAVRRAGPGEVDLLHDGRGDRRQTVAGLRLALAARPGGGDAEAAAPPAGLVAEAPDTA